MTGDLGYTTRYRPETWDSFIGNDAIVKSFRKALENNTSHAFVFAGESGIGKTTLARLGARHVGRGISDSNEIDGATHGSVEEMRELINSLHYKPLYYGQNHCIILDECQAVTAQAWKAALKSVEEPPSWVYWFFCTTELAKVPAAIKTRSIVYQLKPMSLSEICDLLVMVREKEDLKIPDSTILICAKVSQGSPRKALSNLAACHNAANEAEAYEILSEIDEKNLPGPIALARALVKNPPPSWGEMMSILGTLKDTNPESIRHVVRAYITTVLLDTKDAKTAAKLLPVLDEFNQPINYNDGISPIIVAIGKAIFR